MQQQFVGIDWATRRARWCALTRSGGVIDEGWMPADEDGLAILVGHLGPEAGRRSIAAPAKFNDDPDNLSPQPGIGLFPAHGQPPWAHPVPFLSPGTSRGVV